MENRTHQPWTRSELQKAKELRATGMFYYEIAAILGRTANGVGAVLREKYSHVTPETTKRRRTLPAAPPPTRDEKFVAAVSASIGKYAVAMRLTVEQARDKLLGPEPRKAAPGSEVYYGTCSAMKLAA